MTALLSWRNPQGREDNWAEQNLYQIDNPWIHAGKIICIEIPLVLLAITAVVETVVYSIFTFVSLILYPITDRPFAFSVKLLESSSFTILWALAVTVRNFYFINMMTKEIHALDVTPLFHPSTPITKEGWIDAGVRFIQEEILQGCRQETLELVKDLDSDIYLFILTKAVYMYAAGNKRNLSIPHFFTEETKEKILDFRSEVKEQKILGKLQELMRDYTQFTNLPDDSPVLKEFNRLRAIGSEELQGRKGLLGQQCFMQVAENLSNI
jgi:hypothetical protein